MRARKPVLPPDQNDLARELASLKLQGSGLDLDDSKKLHIEILSAAQTQALGFDPLPSLKINYLGPTGKPLSDWQNAGPFYRVRYLAQAPGFEKLTDKKPKRYVQPPNTVCCAYFPRSQDWQLLRDTTAPILLTEGELKAASACKFGFPTIGLGGVYNWRSKGHGVGLLPELAGIDWRRRYAYLCFDSDYKTNPMICAALRELAEELVEHGAYVYMACMPSAGGEKTGLDDFLVAQGAQALKELLHAAPALGLTDPLFELNKKYVYIANPGLVLATESLAKVAPAAFTGHLEAAKTYQEKSVKSDGTCSYKPVSAAAAWIAWPLRHQAPQLTYAPGQPALVEPSGFYNIWPGWGVEPKKGDVKPFLKLIEHLFGGAEEAAKKWFLQWCAWPLQRPGTKLFSSCVFYGVRHGTGKSLVGYTLGRIYGKNFAEISQADLHSSFNEWAEGKQFILGDEVTGSDRRQDAAQLKKLITQQEMRVNVKYVPSYVVPDCVNYFLTSNQPDAVYLEDDDRRTLVHEVTVGPLDDAFYHSYMEWLDGGGSAALFHWLLSLDTSGFNPKAAALRTAARERMIADVQSDLGGWVRALVATPDAVLRVGEIAIPKDLFTSAELLRVYDPTGSTRATANGLGRELKRAGVPQACSGQPVRLADGSQGRFYVVRSRSKWAAAGPSQVAAHVGARPAAAEAKF